MKGLRVEIVVRREGAPVEEAIAQPVEDVATVLARAGHESGGPRTPSRGPLRRSWAILRPRFSWSGPDSPENVQNRPLTASGPSDGPAVRIPKAPPTAKAAGLHGSFSGHSGRVGMARDLVSAGASVPAVQVAGRWASADMPAPSSPPVEPSPATTGIEPSRRRASRPIDRRSPGQPPRQPSAPRVLVCPESRAHVRRRTRALAYSAPDAPLRRDPRNPRDPPSPSGSTLDDARHSPARDSGGSRKWT